MLAHISSVNHGVYQKGQSLLWDAADSQNRKLDNGTCYWRCHKRSCAARITIVYTWHRQQTNGHNHAVNPATTQVEEVKSKLRKRAISETTCSTSEPV